MVVKKTKTGKLSVLLPLEVRATLWSSIVNVCEDQSVKQMINPMQSYEEVMAKLYLFTLYEILTTKSFHLQAGWDTRILFKKSESLAIMWLIRHSDDLSLLNLKSSLHKTLIG